ncbi:MAG TPA: hypothetical protein VI933_04920 [archaeon]|nr:hypothetical protein [archaeon]
MSNPARIFEQTVDNFPDADRFAAVVYLGKPNHFKRGSKHDYDTVVLLDRRYPMGAGVLAGFELNREYQRRLVAAGIRSIPFVYSVTMEDRAVLGKYNSTRTLLHHSMIFADMETLMKDGIIRGWFAKNLAAEGTFVRGSVDDAYSPEFLREDQFARAYFYLQDAMNCALIRGAPVGWLEWKLREKTEYARKWSGLTLKKLAGKESEELLEIAGETLLELDEMPREAAVVRDF